MLQRLRALLKKDVWEVVVDLCSTAQDKEAAARHRQGLNEIRALTFDEARHQAEHLLTDPQRFNCIVALDGSAPLAVLAPGLRSLFSRYRRIEVIQSDAVLDRDAVSMFSSSWYKGPNQLWQIGTDVWDDAILVKPHQEGLYDPGNPDVCLVPDHPSVYHWLLAESAIPSDFDPQSSSVICDQGG